MFGIDVDKLLLVGILVGLIVGPTRLRGWRRELPRIVGRVHALYQQGRADVTRDLDDLAPDWREYDPRQFHPRRILRDLGADVRREAESVLTGANGTEQRGESPGEPPTHPLHEEGSGQAACGVGDDVEDAADAPRQEQPLRGLDQQRNSPRDDENRPGASRQEQREQDAEGQEEQHVQREIHFASVGGGKQPEGEPEEQIGVPIEVVGRQEDDREPDEVQRREHEDHRRGGAGAPA